MIDILPRWNLVCQARQDVKDAVDATHRSVKDDAVD